MLPILSSSPLLGRILETVCSPSCVVWFYQERFLLGTHNRCLPSAFFCFVVTALCDAKYMEYYNIKCCLLYLTLSKIADKYIGQRAGLLVSFSPVQSGSGHGSACIQVPCHRNTVAEYKASYTESNGLGQGPTSECPGHFVLRCVLIQHTGLSFLRCVRSNTVFPYTY